MASIIYQTPPTTSSTQNSNQKAYLGKCQLRNQQGHSVRRCTTYHYARERATTFSSQVCLCFTKTWSKSPSFLSSMYAFRSRFFPIFKLSNANFSFSSLEDALLQLYPSSHTRHQCFLQVSLAFPPFPNSTMFLPTFSRLFSISILTIAILFFENFVNSSTSNLDLLRHLWLSE